MDGQDKEMFEKLTYRVSVLERDVGDAKKNKQDLLTANAQLVDRCINYEKAIEELRGELRDSERRIALKKAELKSAADVLDSIDVSKPARGKNSTKNLSKWVRERV